MQKYVIMTVNEDEIIAIKDTEEETDAFMFNYYISEGVLCYSRLFDDFGKPKKMPPSPKHIVLKAKYDTYNDNVSLLDTKIVSRATEKSFVYPKFEGKYKLLENKENSNKEILIKFDIEKDYQNSISDLVDDIKKDAIETIYAAIDNKEIENI